MERFDKDIAMEIAKSLGASYNIIHSRFYEAIKAIERATSINAVMEAKQELMSAIVMALPVQDDTCYFCLYDQQHRDTVMQCEDCSYGIVHGTCGRVVDNTWQALRTMKYDLIYHINKHYWTGGELENAEYQRHQDRQVEDTSMGKT